MSSVSVFSRLLLGLLFFCGFGCGVPSRVGRDVRVFGRSGLTRSAEVARGVPLLGGECDGSGTQSCATDAGRAVLVECIEGNWVEASICHDACASTSQCTSGCSVTSDGRAQCICTAGAGCPGHQSCDSHHLLLVPSDNEQMEESVDCDTFCEAQNPDALALGCGYDILERESRCLCGRPGQECEAEQPICVGSVVAQGDGSVLATSKIATCEAGILVFHVCSEVCDDDDALCWNRKGYFDVCSCQA